MIKANGYDVYGRMEYQELVWLLSSDTEKYAIGQFDEVEDGLTIVSVTNDPQYPGLTALVKNVDPIAVKRHIDIQNDVMTSASTREIVLLSDAEYGALYEKYHTTNKHDDIAKDIMFGTTKSDDDSLEHLARRSI